MNGPTTRFQHRQTLDTGKTFISTILKPISLTFKQITLMKKTLFTLAFAFIALFAVNTAQAQNPHFTDVVVSEDGLTVTGKVAGLGNSSGLVTITYSASASVGRTCSTRGNGMNVPPFTIETQILSDSDSYSAARNGRVTFSLSLDLSMIGGDTDLANCPNGLVANVLESVLSKSLTFTTESGKSGSYDFAE
jgi:hypothetical protein